MAILASGVADALQQERVSVSGIVKLRVVNNVPEITSMELEPSEIYPDSMVECRAEVEDEFPEAVRVVYAIRTEKGEHSSSAALLNGEEEGSEIVCEATPFDAAGQRGETKRARAVVSEAPGSARAIQAAAGLVGARIRAEEIITAQRQGITAVTGLVAGRAYRNTSATPLLVLSLIVTALIGINITLRTRIRASREGEKLIYQ